MKKTFRIFQIWADKWWMTYLYVGLSLPKSFLFLNISTENKTSIEIKHFNLSNLYSRMQVNRWGMLIHFCLRVVVVEWIRRRTVDHKVRGSSPTAALMSFGKTLIYICHTPLRWSKWVPGRNLFLEMLERRMAAVLKPG